jgi:ribosomal protein S12 methylthiotransferase
VVTGCLAERYGDELAAALPEVDRVAGFGVPVTFHQAIPAFDLLNLPRPPADGPWAYVKVAEGCDRHCGFCAIPSFRGPQRSRRPEDVFAEVERLGVAEVVLVAQDLVSYGRDIDMPGAIVGLVRRVAALTRRTRLLYLYPSGLSRSLIDVMAEARCPYFDLSLQHVSARHLRRMRRWGSAERFTEAISYIRSACPQAAFRSSFIVGYPGETEEDHDNLLAFLEEAQLDWAGFFAFSPEEGTYAAGLAEGVPGGLVAERMAECSELQDRITAGVRASLVGTEVEVLVDRPGLGRSHREAPEIDGTIRVPSGLEVGRIHRLVVTGSEGPDLEAA